MARVESSDLNRWSLIISVIMIGLISLVQPGCNCGSSGNVGTAPIASVFPVQNSTTALVSTNVIAFFGIDMDETTIDDSTFTLTELGGLDQPATVTYDAITRSAVLNPTADLVSGTQYTATISAAVQDAAGNSPLTRDFSWIFTVSPEMLLVSKNESGTTANNSSRIADISSDGHYVVFQSTATNLVDNVTVNGLDQIYRKDNLTGEVLLVSSDSTGLVAANRAAINPRISSNGRFVVFESPSTNLDTLILNTNGITQIYIKDMDDGSIEIASRDALGIADNSLNTAANARVSDDGRFVVFQSADDNLSTTIGQAGVLQVYLKDMSDESVEMISRTLTTAGDDDSLNPDMSPDGSFVVFESDATNLALTTNFRHIYYVDTTIAHAIQQISLSTGGAGATANSFNPSISNDGNKVVFESDATNLDAPDTNGTTDIFIRDRSTPLTDLVSVNPVTQDSGNGASTRPDINGSGDFVAFESNANDLDGGNVGVIDIFVRDLSITSAIDIARVNIPLTGTASTSGSNFPVISSDGRYVSFDSFEGYTLDGTDIFLDVYRAINSTFQPPPPVAVPL